MAWKMFSVDSGSYETPKKEKPRSIPQRKPGDLILLVKSKTSEGIEEQFKISSDMLGYNIGANRLLIRVENNDRSFDQYISMPFTKGVTERESGRTMLILGSPAHHIEAMRGQFDNVLWHEEDTKEIKIYGDTIRWINVGDTSSGFIGLDYNPKASATAGIARTYKDISFLANTLLSLGYNPIKRVFLFSPPYLVESETGRRLRESGIESLLDFSKLK